MTRLFCLFTISLLVLFAVVVANGQVKNYIYFGDRLLAVESVGAACGVNAAYLSGASSGTMRLSCYGNANAVYDSGGAVNTAPQAHQQAQTVYAVSLVSSTPYVRSFNTVSGAWGNWLLPGGTLASTPAIAAANDNDAIYLVGRDAGGSYWLRYYSRASNSFPEPNWVSIGGVWATDPALAVVNSNLAYIFGSDSSGGMWYVRYYRVPPPGESAITFIQTGAIALQTPAAVATSNGVYVLVRGKYGNGAFIGRVNLASNQLTWFSSAGVIDGPLALAASNGILYAASSVAGSVYYATFREADATWGNWTSTGGVLQSLSIAALNNTFYIAGRNAAGNLFWYTLADQWVQYASNIGPFGSATPR